MPPPGQASHEWRQNLHSAQPDQSSRGTGPTLTLLAMSLHQSRTRTLEMPVHSRIKEAFRTERGVTPEHSLPNRFAAMSRS